VINNTLMDLSICQWIECSWIRLFLVEKLGNSSIVILTTFIDQKENNLKISRSQIGAIIKHLFLGSATLATNFSKYGPQLDPDIF